MDDDSGDEGNNELTCVCNEIRVISLYDQQAGDVPRKLIPETR